MSFMLKFAIFVANYSVISDALMHGIEKLRPGYVRFTAALLLVVWSCFAPGPVVRAQSAPQKTVVKGRVADEAGNPLVGVTVVEHGTPNGVATLSDGGFSISVRPGAALDFSCLGYLPRRIVPGSRTELEIVLQEDVKSIEDVIVTALGLERNYVDLTYAADKIKGSQLTAVKSPNLILSLAGKSAGMQVSQSSSGAGSSAKVSIRGVRSVASDNQPLYVVDGMPMLNSSPEQAYSAIGGIADAGNRDGGDGISNLNAEDIESVSVLKGAPAAALYGSQAANGVILITTKKGSAGKQQPVIFSTNLTFQTPFSLPEFQDRYGASGGVESWGARGGVKAYDNAGEFFRTGITAINSVSVSTGSKQLQNYFSYANTAERGITGKNRLMRHNFNLRTTSELFRERLRLDGNISFMRQAVEDKPVPGGFYMNPLVGLYRFPRGEDITPYREHFEVYDQDRKLGVQQWIAPSDDFEQNPYWIVNRIRSRSVRNRVMASLSADWKVNDWLRIRARANVDHFSDKVRQKFYASTAPALAGANGRYVESSFSETLFNGEVLALFDKRFSEKWIFSATAGASLNDRTVNSLRMDSKTASLYYPNVFNVANIVMNSSAYVDEQIDARRQIQSLFATASVKYAESLTFEVTGRNDWASTLAYTSAEGRGYFYYSLGTSWVIGKMFKLPEWISLGKVRLTWSRVGNDIPMFITNPKAHVTAGGGINAADAAPGTELKPEMTRAVEAGLEWRFFGDRLGVNATYYKTNTRNQFFKLPALSGEAYAFRYENAGNIENEGVEISLNAYPVYGKALTWQSTVNFSHNKNRVIKLHDELREYVYGPSSFSSSYAMKLVEGGSIGDIYGRAFERDENGAIVYETDGDYAGLPRTRGEGNTVKVGNANPVFALSWNNTFSYKGVSLSMLVDCRYGGHVLSQTMADLDSYGVTKATADARDRGYVTLEGRRIENVRSFYKLVGGRAGVTEYYMYDATNIRLREVSLSYALPGKLLRRTGVFSGATVSFVARNLFFIYNAAPFDPDLILSTGNDNQGIDVFGMPTVRSFGFNIKLEF